MSIIGRPSDPIPDFATDTTIATGDETGLSVRVDPSAETPQGAIGGRRYAARWLNWVLGVNGDWLRYLLSASDDTRGRVGQLTAPTIGVSPYINDNSRLGTGGQTVNNTPRAVRSSDSNALNMTCSANAGDKLIVEIGPLFVQPIYVPSTTPTVFVAAKVAQGSTTVALYTTRYDAESNPNLSKTPLSMRFSYHVATTGTHSVTLFAWALQLNDSVSILSPGVYGSTNASTWPALDDPNQQWGSITILRP